MTLWMTRHCRFCIALVAALMLLPTLAGCHRTADEEQVRQAIAAGAAAARGNDVDGVMAQVSDDFVGNDGDVDRRSLRRMLALRAFRHDSTGVLTGPIAIERKSLPGTGGDRLVATFTLTLTGGKPGSLLPDQADVFAMSTAWRKEGSHWRCYSASWSSRMR